MNRFELINAIVDDTTTLTSTQKAILTTLWRFSDERGISYPSVSKIMSCSGIANQKTYYNNRDKLIELGWLKVEQIKGKGCIYQIEVPTQSQILQFDTVPTSNIVDTDTNNIAEQTNHLKYQKTNILLTKDNPYFEYLNGGWMLEEFANLDSCFLC